MQKFQDGRQEAWSTIKGDATGKNYGGFDPNCKSIRSLAE